MSEPFLIRALAASGALALLGACEPVEIGQNPTPNAASVLPLPSPMSVEQQSLAPAAAVEVDDPTGAVASVYTTSLSDENDFEAVAARQSIESDAKRLAESRAKYVVIEPTDLPVRPGTNEISIIEYALRTTNPVGVQIYRRSGLYNEELYLRSCNFYASPSEAQQVFLKRSGPKMDWMGLDPDGDGFACSWDPTPFRLAGSSG